ILLVSADRRRISACGSSDAHRQVAIGACACARLQALRQQRQRGASKIIATSTGRSSPNRLVEGAMILGVGQTCWGRQRQTLARNCQVSVAMSTPYDEDPRPTGEA